MKKPRLTVIEEIANKSKEKDLPFIDTAKVCKFKFKREINIVDYSLSVKNRFNLNCKRSLFMNSSKRLERFNKLYDNEDRSKFISEYASNRYE